MQASIKYSPYFMLFQKDMRLPIDCEMTKSRTDSESSIDDEFESCNEVVTMLLEKREDVFHSANENIISSQKAQKDNYDRKHAHACTLSVGTKVLLKNTAQKQRRGGTWILDGWVLIL